MSIPDFNLETKAGIFTALDYIRDTSAKNSIDGKLVSNVNRAIMNTFLDDLTTTEQRKLKNYFDKIDSGQYSVDGVRFPLGIKGNKIEFLVYSSNLAPEEILLQKTLSAKLGWLIGEPDYEVKAKSRIEAEPGVLKEGEYFSLSSGFSQVLFGRNLGFIEEGQTLSGVGKKYHSNPARANANFYVEKMQTNHGGDFFEDILKCTIEDNTGLGLEYYCERMYKQDKNLVTENENLIDFFITRPPQIRAYANKDIYMPVGKRVKLQAFKNGVSGGVNYWQQERLMEGQSMDIYGYYIEDHERDVELKLTFDLVDANTSPEE